MDYTFEELKKKNVSQLREIAAGIDHAEVQGYTQMHKDHLLAALCKALGIDMFEHHVAKNAHKSEIKTKINKLKTKRDEAIAEHNHSELRNIRRQIHYLKRILRKAAV
jgi:16S rRNA C967 or C1407 C5-methylase (RsmB/RsmF family)